MPAERLCSSQPMPDSKVTSPCSSGQGPISMRPSSALLNYTLRDHLTCGVWLALSPLEQESKNVVTMDDYIPSNVKTQIFRVELTVAHAFVIGVSGHCGHCDLLSALFSTQCGHGSDKIPRWRCRACHTRPGLVRLYVRKVWGPSCTLMAAGKHMETV